LSDKIGRKKTMSLTILFYSLFTALSAFSQQWWHLASLRFFVAMGVGGEWAVASAFVAEVFPKKARPYVGSIFHASGTIGTYLAVAAGAFLIGNASLLLWCHNSCPNWLTSLVDPTSLPWRLGFALGVLPALLIIWIRTRLKEPDNWMEAKRRAKEDDSQKMGSFFDIFRGRLFRSTLVGLVLSTVGMATFWAVHIYGKNVMYNAAYRDYHQQGEIVSVKSDPGSATSENQSISAVVQASLKRWEMLGMFLVTTGLFVGQLAFGPICRKIGRRAAFFLYHMGAFVISIFTFHAIQMAGFLALLERMHISLFVLLYVTLPIFGFLTAGMHAGYAIYFPELYPTRLRGTGAGFCFNAGRLTAAPVLIGIGVMQNRFGLTISQSATILSSLYLLGIAILSIAPETKEIELPE